MRPIPLILALSVTLAIAGSAAAALPTAGSFAGTTSARSMNGFQDVVTFNALHGGTSIHQFQFGTTGCVGIGKVPVGVDPYIFPNEGTIPSIKVSAKGVIDYSGTLSLPDSQGIVTKVLIKATFASSTSVSGTISVSQSENGSGSCSAPPLKFSAKPGTPQSLGLSGT